MELTETIETINRQLVDLYGIDTLTGLPIWRVVWSEDQFEKRLGTYEDFSPGGIYLKTVTEVRLVPKYKYINAKYILERLVLVPDVNTDELPTVRMSYEPMWPFQDSEHNYLPPKFEVCQIVIDTVYAAMGKGSLAKYVEPDADQPAEVKNARIQEIQEELFGNETDTGDALAHGQAIIVPRNFKES